MAHQIRPRPLTQKPPPQRKKAAQRRPGMDDEHRKRIKQLWCCVCGYPPMVDPHHLKKGTGERGMAIKSTDRWAIPLCQDCHHEIESIGSGRELQWLDGHGINGLELAKELWSARASLEAMELALKRHREMRA